MPKGPRGEKRPADGIGRAVMIAKIATGEIEDKREATSRIHKTLRVTPAMAAGVTNRLWEIADIAKLVESAETAHKARDPYKKTLA